MTELASMKPQVYKDERPSEYFAPFYERARTKTPNWIYEVVRVGASLFSWILFRARSVGAENVPPSGALIVAPNHFSYADHFFVACFIRRRVRFMAKSQLFKGVAAKVYSHGGVFPVRRGVGDVEALRTADLILERGGAITMYPEGGRSRSGKLSDRVRPGIGRLALQSGAAIVPVAIHGSSHVRNWKKGRFPRVTVAYGKPMKWEKVESPTRAQQQEVADAVFAEIRRLYDGLVEERGWG